MNTRAPAVPVPQARGEAFLAMIRAVQRHWPEYLMEAAGLGLFMMSACAFALVLAHPQSPVAASIKDSQARRALMGIAMGMTAVAIIYSPWGKQSGAHLNPSVTMTFFRLGKVAGWDTVFYCVFQFLGGIAGVLVMTVMAGDRLADPAVNYVVTVPGPRGIWAAFLTEFAISLVMMLVVLFVTNSRFARWTGVCAGFLLAWYIGTVGPLSGMSMNPARSLASALPARTWDGMWIYFSAPPLAMLLASQLYVWIRGRRHVSCAKLHHQNDKRCIFCDDPRLSAADSV